ncbi:MAG TPA: FAD-dependent oxidoreductase [Methanocorpusculum sp.]|nr:FAD-dependent oxidoreductase [Methanocorpusculum sp.]
MQKEIEVYTLPSCPRSKRVKAFLNEKGVKYVNYNVDDDNKAYNRMVKLTDQYTVPVTVIDGDIVILGDDLEKIGTALTHVESVEMPAETAAEMPAAESVEAAAVECESVPESISEPVLEVQAEPVPEPELPPVECELAVLGCGTAGLSAAFYAGRKGLDVVVISDKNGGITRQRRTIAGYPGVMEIAGADLMTNICEQAHNAGAKFVEDAPRSISKGDDGKFFIETAGGAKFIAKSVIAAPGSHAAFSDAEGEKEYLGRGVYFCPVAEPEEFKDKHVAVFGDGNIALEAAAELAECAKEVHVITRAGWKADAGVAGLLKSGENVVYHHGFAVKSVGGKDSVEYAVIQKLENRLFGGTKKLRIDALVLGVGFEPDTAVFAGLAELNDAKEIVVDTEGKTSCEGLFAAGSATSVKAKCAVSSAGDGAKAALSAFAYLRK